MGCLSVPQMDFQDTALKHSDFGDHLVDTGPHVDPHTHYSFVLKHNSNKFTSYRMF